MQVRHDHRVESPRRRLIVAHVGDDPVIERVLTPRLALTVAEDLAFTGGRHVLVVMTALRVPPGRAGALLLRRRLAVAEAGADLLTRKLSMLSVERVRLSAAADQAARRWRDASVEAQRWLERSAMLTGDRGLRLAALPPSATATFTWINVTSQPT